MSGQSTVKDLRLKLAKMEGLPLEAGKVFLSSWESYRAAA